MVKVNALREEHRRITVGIERQHTVVQLLSLTVGLGLIHQPTEQGQAFFEALWMPLYTNDRLILAALHRLDKMVG